MRHALIIAGGSGTRLWPMSRAGLPKQLIPFIGGKSLLQLAVDRLHGLVPDERIHICAAESHRAAIVQLLKGKDAADRFYGEPMGRDTLNAVGLAAAIIGHRDPEAVIAVLTADHVIEPVDRFQEVIAQGFAVAEQHPDTLVTFGIKPTFAATGYGYLELGAALEPSPNPEGVTGRGQGEGTSGQGRASDSSHQSKAGIPSPQPSPSCPAGAGRGGKAHLLTQYKEKPDAATAKKYLDAGPEKYLWSSGMFVWRAATMMECIRRFVPENHEGLARLGREWDTGGRVALLEEIYPKLKKISVDFAVMEPAARGSSGSAGAGTARLAGDPGVRVAAVPMDLTWLDVGSWPAFAETCGKDAAGNAVGGGKHLLLDTKNTLAASSDPNHVIATIGCENLIVIHTPDATLVCRADRAEEIKKLHGMIGEKFGGKLI